MKNRKKLVSAMVVLLLLFPVLIFAQTTGTATASVTINEVALLNVDTASAPTFIVNDLGSLGAAGELPLISPSGGPTYLQYTVVSAGTDYRITAASDLAMLAGLKMDIWAATPTGTGGVGTPVAGGLEIDSSYTAGTASDLITGITSCATGSGTTQGPAIYYTLSIDESTFDAMVAGANTEYTITYTLISP